jgi:TPR repeat protein
MILRPTAAAAILLAGLLMAGPAPADNDDVDLLRAGNAAYGRGDYVTAYQAWKALADAGYAVAQYNIAAMYESGRGMGRDLGEAARWYKLAAESSYPDALYRLARFADSPELARAAGVPYDPAQALDLDRQAASYGHGGAAVALGWRSRWAGSTRREKGSGAIRSRRRNGTSWGSSRSSTGRSRPRS